MRWTLFGSIIFERSDIFRMLCLPDFDWDVDHCQDSFDLLYYFYKRDDRDFYIEEIIECCEQIPVVGGFEAMADFVVKADSNTRSSPLNPNVHNDLILLYKSICLVHENDAIDVVAKYRRDLTREQVKELLNTTVWPYDLDFNIWLKCIELLDLGRIV